MNASSTLCFHLLFVDFQIKPLSQNQALSYLSSATI